MPYSGRVPVLPEVPVAWLLSHEGRPPRPDSSDDLGASGQHCSFSVGGFLRHRNWMTLVVATIGLVLVVVAATLGHDLFGHEIEVVMTVIGSAMLVYGHIRNIKFRRLENSATDL